MTFVLTTYKPAYLLWPTQSRVGQPFPAPTETYLDVHNDQWIDVNVTLTPLRSPPRLPVSVFVTEDEKGSFNTQKAATTEIDTTVNLTDAPGTHPFKLPAQADGQIVFEVLGHIEVSYPVGTIGRIKIPR